MERLCVLWCYVCNSCHTIFGIASILSHHDDNRHEDTNSHHWFSLWKGNHSICNQVFLNLKVIIWTLHNDDNDLVTNCECMYVFRLVFIYLVLPHPELPLLLFKFVGEKQALLCFCGNCLKEGKPLSRYFGCKAVILSMIDITPQVAQA